MRTGTATPSSRRSPREPAAKSTLSAGTLYRSIQRLLEQGLIAETRERPAPELDDQRRRYYRITPVRPSRRPGGGPAAGAAGQAGPGAAASRRREPDAAVPRAAPALSRLVPRRIRRGDVRRSSSAASATRAACSRMRAVARRGLGDVLVNAAAVHWDLAARRTSRYTARTLGRAPGLRPHRHPGRSRSASAPTPPRSRSRISSCSGRCRFPTPTGSSRSGSESPGYAQMELSPPNYPRLEAASTRRSSGWAPTSAIGATWSARASPSALEGAAVTAELLPMLGVQPALGRIFTAADDRDGAPRTVILSHGLWQAALRRRRRASSAGSRCSTARPTWSSA